MRCATDGADSWRTGSVTVGELATATAGFLALSIIYTWPLVTVFTTDTLWLGLTQALLANAAFLGEELAAGGWPLDVGRILAPTGYTLHEGLLPSVIVALGGGLTGVNIGLLLSFTLAGTAAYMLAREVTPMPAAAFLGGCLFTFAPQHFANGGTYPIFPIQWPAFFVVALLAFRRSHSAGWLALLGVSFAASCLSSWYFGVFLGLVTAAFTLCLAADRDQLRTTVAVALVLIATCALLIPFTPLVLLGSSGLATGGLALIAAGSADLLSFALPPAFHWLWGPQVFAFQQHWLGDLSLQSNTLSLTAVALAVVALWTGAVRTRLLVFLLGTAIGFWLLSLGPFLAVGGLGDWQPGQPVDDIEAVRLPYYWLADVFPFSTTRATARYAIVTTLMLSALAAAGAGALASRLPRRWRQPLVAVLLTAALAEFWPVWPLVPDRPVALNPFYRRLAGQPAEGSVVELPFRNNGYRVLYNSAAHRHRVIGGAVDKPFARFSDHIQGYPLLRKLRRIGPPPAAGSVDRDVTQDYPEEFFDEVIAGLDIRYAVLHKWNQNIFSFGDYRQPDPIFEPLARFLQNHFEIHYDDADLLVFTPRRHLDDWLYPVIASGFGDVEDHGSYLQRVMLGEVGHLQVHSSRTATADIVLGLAVILTPTRRVHLALNGETVHQAELSERTAAGEFHRIVLPDVQLRRGLNSLTISTPQPALTIADVYGGADRRPISFLLHQFRVSRSDQQAVVSGQPSEVRQ